MLQKLTELLDEKTVEATQYNPTFLSVIGREHDEDFISRVVAYCLSTNQSFVKRLVERYIQRRGADKDVDLSRMEHVRVFAEKMMGFGRADIFVELTDACGRLITITIENKIYTHEHMTGEAYQTQVYYEWVTRHPRYTNAVNVFYYLKPDYNVSCAMCEWFDTVTYAQVASMIGDTDDVITQDFIRHIEYALRGDNMVFDAIDRLFLDNYQAFENKRAEAIKKIRAYQDLLVQKIEQQLDMAIVDWKHADDAAVCSEKECYGAGIGSYRMYRKPWYKQNEYYFYVEIKFEHGCMDQIYFQCTLRDDEKERQEHRVPRFVRETEGVQLAEVDGRYYVIEQQAFFDQDWGTPEWEERFVVQAVQYLRQYLERMDHVFEKYRVFES